MSAHDKTKSTPSAWTLSSDRNPYIHNVFSLLQIDPDMGENELLTQCRRLAGRLKAGHRVEAHGRAVEDADISRAHYLRANAEEFVAERLVTHTVHSLDPSEFRSQAEAIEAVPIATPEEILPLPLCDPSFLTRLLPQLSPIPSEDSTPLPLAVLVEICRPEVSEERGFDL